MHVFSKSEMKTDLSVKISNLKLIYFHLFIFFMQKVEDYFLFSLAPKQSFNDVYYIAYTNCISIGEGN